MRLSIQLFAIAICLLAGLAFAQSDRGESLHSLPLQPDVRVLIDISGSMKKNDPGNLRRPAVDLLIKLLPDESRAGLWLFGNAAQPLMPHAQVTEDWRRLATSVAGEIGSSDMFTDIGAALEAAAAAGPADADHRTSLILLTDGVVDISKDPEANEREWQRIVDEVLPRLKAQGFVIHTIALSDNTDRNLLRKLSLATGGLAAVADTADELMATFIKILDAAAPSEQVTLDGNRFEIDSSIEEFTALIFRDDKSDTKLRAPDGTAYSRATAPASVSWYESETYDLVTVSSPQVGQWQVTSELGPGSRITVVSDLNLRLRSLPVNVYRGQALPVSFALREDAAILRRPDFLKLMTFQLELFHNADGESPSSVWQDAIPMVNPPASGIINTRLPAFASTGDYRLVVRVDGKSFQREVSHTFSVRTPFAAEIVGETDADGELHHLLLLRSNSAAIRPDQTQVVATLYDPEGRRHLRPMVLDEQQHWQLELHPSVTGRYEVKVTVRGTEKGGAVFNYELDDLTFYYAPERGFIQTTQAGTPVLIEDTSSEVAADPAVPGPAVPELAVPEPAAEPDAAVSPPEPEPAAPESPADSGPEPATELGTAVSSSLLYGGILLGNLLLFGGGFLVYRRLAADRDREAAVLEELGLAEPGTGAAEGDAGAVDTAAVGGQPGPIPDQSAKGEAGAAGSPAAAAAEASLDDMLSQLEQELDSADEQDAPKVPAGGASKN